MLPEVIYFFNLLGKYVLEPENKLKKFVQSLTLFALKMVTPLPEDSEGLTYIFSTLDGTGDAPELVINLADLLEVCTIVYKIAYVKGKANE